MGNLSDRSDVTFVRCLSPAAPFSSNLLLIEHYWLGRKHNYQQVCRNHLYHRTGSNGGYEPKHPNTTMKTKPSRYLFVRQNANGKTIFGTPGFPKSVECRGPRLPESHGWILRERRGTGVRISQLKQKQNLVNKNLQK